MKRKNFDLDLPGGVLPLTEPDLKAKGDVVTKYQLAKVRYQTYYDALELLLTPQQLTLVERTIQAKEEMRACMAEYAAP